ncbi:uncharacterized protein [Montipora capricornis]|uniref:uncharacterized protein n=2 Tax=Montipora TaxID=46703 RepID=UPI0035F1C1E1
MFLRQSYKITMYDIYVTNQCVDNVYIRLHPQRINNLGVDIHQQWTGAVADESSLRAFLMRWEFCPIPPRIKPMPFVIGMDRNLDSSRRLFASLYANSKLRFIDKEVDYMNFGCLFIRSTWGSTSEEVFYLTQENPEPVWLAAKTGDKLPERRYLIKADSEEINGAAYFGRVHGRIPCIVTSSNDQCDKWVGPDLDAFGSGALLKTNGHQWLRARSGDPVPPNSVIVGLSDTEGSLYLGRVGGNTPCSISSESGKIKQFFYCRHKKETRIENGELMVLTNDTKGLC